MARLGPCSLGSLRAALAERQLQPLAQCLATVCSFSDQTYQLHTGSSVHAAPSDPEPGEEDSAAVSHLQCAASAFAPILSVPSGAEMAAFSCLRTCAHAAGSVALCKCCAIRHAVHACRGEARPVQLLTFGYLCPLSARGLTKCDILSAHLPFSTSWA